MKVKHLIEQLNKLNPEMDVLGEFDMDGDGFMIKADVVDVYQGNAIDDSSGVEVDEDEMYCIIRIEYGDDDEI
jgi:hypothetical protein